MARYVINTRERKTEKFDIANKTAVLSPFFSSKKREREMSLYIGNSEQIFFNKKKTFLHTKKNIFREKKRYGEKNSVI